MPGFWVNSIKWSSLEMSCHGTDKSHNICWHIHLPGLNFSQLTTIDQRVSYANDMQGLKNTQVGTVLQGGRCGYTS
jgi:hypothetical protein